MPVCEACGRALQLLGKSLERPPRWVCTTPDCSRTGLEPGVAV